MSTRLAWLLVAACSSTPNGGQPDDAQRADSATSDGSVTLDPSPGEYRDICDASGAIAIDFTHFLAFSDNDQLVRFYERGAKGPALRSTEISASLGLVAGDEADFEDTARIGAKIYVIESHGRKKTGALDTARYRLFAADVDANGGITVTGSTSQLLQQMLDSARWDKPDSAVIAALQASSRLAEPKVPDLDPKLNGTNIEGLGFAPTATSPERVLIGFRNPRPNNRAIVVSLLNPAEVVTGAPARFGEAITLDLGGLGIRGMAWSDALAAVIFLAGPVDSADAPFRLYRWIGTADSPPVLLTELTTPAFLHPESVVVYPGSRDVQLLYDNDDLPVGGNPCNEAAAAQRSFSDQIIHIP